MRAMHAIESHMNHAMARMLPSSIRAPPRNEAMYPHLQLHHKHQDYEHVDLQLTTDYSFQQRSSFQRLQDNVLFQKINATKQLRNEHIILNHLHKK